MSTSVWRLPALVTVVIGLCAAAGGVSASARTSSYTAAHAQRGGPLSGSWSGHIGSGSTRQPMQITINARETAGSWKISASCYGPLTLDSISDGYHHFRRHVASGASCAGGDVDCLKRAGAELYDAVTSHLGGSWDTSGTFRRVRA
jgi:hypothetical protein